MLLQIFGIVQECKEFFFIFLTFPDDTVDRRKLGIRNTVTQGLDLIVHLPGF